MEVTRKHEGGCGTREPGGGPDHGGQLLPPCGVQELEEAEAEAEAGGGREEEEGCGQSLGKGGGGKRGVNRRDDGRIDGGGDGNGNNGKQCQIMQVSLGKTKTWMTTGRAVPPPILSSS